MALVAVRSIQGSSLVEVVQSLLVACHWEEIIPRNGMVAIKLNVSVVEPNMVESANTSPDLVDAVCRVLKARTDNIALVEADGDYRNKAEQAFAATGIYEVADKLKIRTFNLSKMPCKQVGNPLLSQLPEILLECEAFITMPVIKTHTLTYFTGALKNQWGCVPRFDRLALHQYLNELIVELNALLKPRLSIMDGIVGMDGRGPTSGRPRHLNILLASRDPVALDATAMRLVGLNPERCRHLLMASEAGLGTLDEGLIEIDMPFARSWDDFEPAVFDWPYAP